MIGKARIAGMMTEGLERIGSFAANRPIVSRFAEAAPGVLIGGLTGGLPGAILGGIGSGGMGQVYRTTLPKEARTDIRGMANLAAATSGLGAGLIPGAIGMIGGMFGGNEQQQQAPQQSMTQLNQAPAGASQPISQVIGMESVTPLNEEQVKKAQKRAMEQAALNAFYAQQLGQYNGGQE